MDIVEMVLGGRVNKSLVQLMQQAGGRAIGLSGKDGDMLKARQVRSGVTGHGTVSTQLEAPLRNGQVYSADRAPIHTAHQASIHTTHPASIHTVHQP
eukprot:365631-Chlamydomonas_euryale.AAC.3